MMMESVYENGQYVFKHVCSNYPRLRNIFQTFFALLHLILDTFFFSFFDFLNISSFPSGEPILGSVGNHHVRKSLHSPNVLHKRTSQCPNLLFACELYRHIVVVSSVSPFTSR